MKQKIHEILTYGRHFLILYLLPTTWKWLRHLWMNPSGCLSRQVSPSHPSSEAVLTLAKSLASSQNAATASRTANCPRRCIITASTARWVIFFFFLTDAYKWKCQFLATSHRDIIFLDVWQIFFPTRLRNLASWRLYHSRSQQRTDQRVLLLTLKFG